MLSEANTGTPDVGNLLEGELDLSAKIHLLATRYARLYQALEQRLTEYHALFSENPSVTQSDSDFPRCRHEVFPLGGKSFPAREYFSPDHRFWIAERGAFVILFNARAFAWEIRHDSGKDTLGCFQALPRGSASDLRLQPIGLYWDLQDRMRDGEVERYYLALQIMFHLQPEWVKSRLMEQVVKQDLACLLDRHFQPDQRYENQVCYYLMKAIFNSNSPTRNIQISLTRHDTYWVNRKTHLLYLLLRHNHINEAKAMVRQSTGSWPLWARHMCTDDWTTVWLYRAIMHLDPRRHPVREPGFHIDTTAPEANHPREEVEARPDDSTIFLRWRTVRTTPMATAQEADNPEGLPH